MKNQALFRKKLKCRLLQFLFGTLRVNVLIVFDITKLIRPTKKLTIFQIEKYLKLLWLFKSYQTLKLGVKVWLCIKLSIFIKSLNLPAI